MHGTTELVFYKEIKYTVCVLYLEGPLIEVLYCSTILIRDINNITVAISLFSHLSYIVIYITVCDCSL